jgi:hypothetical protein
VSGNRAPHAGAVGCTTRRRNAHRTDTPDERQVLYPWHPWAGCAVHVHEVIEKASGAVLRCSRGSVAKGRWLELPAWMFDRAACLPMQMAARPRVDGAALSALQALLAQTAGREPGDPPSSNAPVSGAARDSCGQNRGDAHATPAPPSRASSATTPPARSVRSARPGELRSTSVGMAHAPRRDASGGDRPDGAAHVRTRARRSSVGPEGGGR